MKRNIKRVTIGFNDASYVHESSLSDLKSTANTIRDYFFYDGLPIAGVDGYDIKIYFRAADYVQGDKIHFRFYPSKDISGGQSALDAFKVVKPRGREDNHLSLQKVLGDDDLFHFHSVMVHGAISFLTDENEREIDVAYAREFMAIKLQGAMEEIGLVCLQRDGAFQLQEGLLDIYGHYCEHVFKRLSSRQRPYDFDY